MMGQMCVLHRSVYVYPTAPEKRFIMVACDSRCPQHRSE